MTRITWNAVGERFYESGLDRGVLFVEGLPGVPWNGLVSVAESSNTELKPYYIDGVKYLQLASRPEYEAVVSAYSHPREFNECVGVNAIHSGLYITGQRNKSFGFSYRTGIGNDVSDNNAGYKIHLVYGALATPETISYSTTADTTSPVELSYKIETLGERIAGYYRTAHLVIDSRYTGVTEINEIQDLIYGTDTTIPTLPTAQEVALIFGA